MCVLYNHLNVDNYGQPPKISEKQHFFLFFCIQDMISETIKAKYYKITVS